jgi:hypothetical protein
VRRSPCACPAAEQLSNPARQPSASREHWMRSRSRQPPRQPRPTDPRTSSAKPSPQSGSPAVSTSPRRAIRTPRPQTHRSKTSSPTESRNRAPARSSRNACSGSRRSGSVAIAASRVMPPPQPMTRATRAWISWRHCCSNALRILPLPLARTATADGARGGRVFLAPAATRSMRAMATRWCRSVPSG